MAEARVGVIETGLGDYPPAPFSPPIRYPEYPFEDISPAGNPVYDAVRRLLASLGMDESNFGAPGWNPLRGLIRPGMRVLVKPNLVRHYHPYGLDPRAIVTHGSVVRAICDYIVVALGGRGEMVIADAPLQSCDFGAVLALAGIDAVASYYRARGVTAEIRDLRLVRAVAEHRGFYGKVLVQVLNGGDPLGYTTIDLGRASLHSSRRVDDSRYRVTCYDPDRMRKHHGEGRHEYVIANTLLQSDVVINLPKMKTHHKAGLTGALKNFIGINGHKDCLPHHVKGSAVQGGDEYRFPDWRKRLDSWILDLKETSSPVLVKKTAAVAHRVLHAVHMRGGGSYWEGSWHGNDTISRTTLDLNRIVRYAARDGGMQQTAQREVLSLVDGVIAGDMDGPLAPRPRQAKVLVAGENAVAVDMVLARMMGFRFEAIPAIVHALEGLVGVWRLADFRPSELRVISPSARWNGLLVEGGGESLGFEPHQGWRGHIEL